MDRPASFWPWTRLFAASPDETRGGYSGDTYEPVSDGERGGTSGAEGPGGRDIRPASPKGEHCTVSGWFVEILTGPVAAYLGNVSPGTRGRIRTWSPSSVR
jgi:hypothetical protein